MNGETDSNGARNENRRGETGGKENGSFIKRAVKAVKNFFKSVFTDETWKCELCKRELFNKEYVCERCKSKLPYIAYGKYCSHCGRRTDSYEQYCSVCKNQLTEIDIGRSVFDYEGKIVPMITGFKFQGRAYLKKFFAEELFKLYSAEGLKADAVTYVPMTDKAVKKRGYNQTLLLAEEFSALSGLEVISVLKKTRDTKHQVGLNRKDRLNNLGGSFGITDKKSAAGKDILLIDDVATTGATGETVARYLKKAGAKRVILLTVASVGYNKKTKNKA